MGLWALTLSQQQKNGSAGEQICFSDYVHVQQQLCLRLKPDFHVNTFIFALLHGNVCTLKSLKSQESGEKMVEGGIGELGRWSHKEKD